MTIMYRQGDVLVVRVDAPVDLSQARRIPNLHGRAVLAMGEATGHAHTVQGAELYEVRRRVLLVVPETSKLEHPEHDAIELAPGQYWVVRQREYRPEAGLYYVAD